MENGKPVAVTQKHPNHLFLPQKATPHTENPRRDGSFEEMYRRTDMGFRRFGRQSVNNYFNMKMKTANFGAGQ
ncbi:MAG: hypothetical protein D6714_09365 [Bacteroidetes bacterium]|nr:MAG: hypothetical protein D6714_09365 [Bacteroidota bacterium]